MTASIFARGCSKFLWIDDDSSKPNYVLPSPDYNTYDKSIIEMFELSFDNEFLQFLVEQSKLYSQFKNYPDHKITNSEIKCSVAILILSGYNKLPGKRFMKNLWLSANR